MGEGFRVSPCWTPSIKISGSNIFFVKYIFAFTKNHLKFNFLYIFKFLFTIPVWLKVGLGCYSILLTPTPPPSKILITFKKNHFEFNHLFMFKIMFEFLFTIPCDQGWGGVVGVLPCWQPPHQNFRQQYNLHKIIFCLRESFKIHSFTCL